MSLENSKNVKILFRFYSDALEDWTVETLWAQIVNPAESFYKIDNIPFFAPIASGDIVYAEYDDTEKMLAYRKTVQQSGNSVVQVVMMDGSVAIDDVRGIFSSLDCESEKLNEGFFTIEILANKNYQSIKNKLSELKEKGTIDLAELFLSDKHFL